MYLYHLISIDLQSSRSFNTHTAKLTDEDVGTDTHYWFLHQTYFCRSLCDQSTGYKHVQGQGTVRKRILDICRINLVDR